jgi:hypothetical protein
MIKSKTLKYILTLLVIALTYSCNEKFDITQFKTDDLGNIGGDTIYVKLNPDWNGFNHPEDIIVGKEPLIYVADTDNDRIVMLNLNGDILGARSIKHPVAIAQDYTLNLIVCGEFDTLGQTFSAVYKIDLVASNHQIETAPIVRLLPRPDDLNTPLRKYTGVCTFYDNSFYVARTGPNNTSIYDPDNSILIFNPKHNSTGDTLIGRVPNISPTSAGLVSATQISSIASFNKRNIDIVVTLTGVNSFKTQWWNYVITPIDERYQSAFSPRDGVAFAQPNNFLRPEGCTIDVSGNIFVADAGKDSVFKFNSLGDKINVFGGSSVFNEPYAVAFFNKILYVADRGNNRILRFQLSTDTQ